MSDFLRLAEDRHWFFLELYGLDDPRDLIKDGSGLWIPNPTPDGKRPIGDAWQTKGKLAAVGRVTTWRERGSNVGLLPGLSGLAVLDVEPSGEAAWPRRRIPPGALVVRTPSGGYHLPLDLAAVERVLGCELTKQELPGVELFGRTGQVVVPPSRARSRKAFNPATGAFDGVIVGEYAVEQEGEPIADEAVLRELLAPFREEAARKNGHEPAPAAPLSTCTSTTPYGAKVLLNERARFAACGSMPGTNRHAGFVGFASEVMKYVHGGEIEQGEALDVLRTAYAEQIPDRPGDLERILGDADGYGRSSPKASESKRTLAAPIIEIIESTPPRIPESANRNGVAALPERARKRFRLLGPGQLGALHTSKDDLIEGVIGRADLGMLFAKPRAGKSFVALDMALSIVTGQPFLGLETRRASVVYMTSEGCSSFPNRIRAWALGHGFTGDDWEQQLLGPGKLFVCYEVPNLAEATETEDLVEQLKELAEPPGLVIIDTLINASLALKENERDSMALGLERASRIKRDLAAACLLVHHEKKNEAEFRGSSAISGACDAMFQISATKAERWFKTTKQKDRAEPLPIAIRLTPVEVLRWEDELGVEHAETSCYVERGLDAQSGDLRTSLLAALQASGEWTKLSELLDAPALQAALEPHRADNAEAGLRSLVRRELGSCVKRGHVEHKQPEGRGKAVLWKLTEEGAKFLRRQTEVTRDDDD